MKQPAQRFPYFSPILVVLAALLAAGCDDGGGDCVYEGVHRTPGSSFPSTDGCNTCGCEAGQVACTARACAPSWYLTCGDPACSGHRADPAVPACTNETEGAMCSESGRICDPINDCNARLVCADSDPRQGPTACPISRAIHKRDIRYLDAGELGAAQQALLDLRLATYRYRSEGPDGPLQLGFLIDDVGVIPAVAPDRERVNLYGYTSMAVAAIQAQEREISALRAELEELRREVEAARTSPAVATRQGPVTGSSTRRGSAASR